MTRVYLPALDGLRFVAFGLVFIHHAPVGDVPLLTIVHSAGWIGVDIFFAISAYLFFVLLDAEKSATAGIATGRFFARRFLRLYPALLLAAVACFALTARSDLNLHALARLAGLMLFADNLFTAVEGYGGALTWGAHLWTISFEFQVYLAIPALFLLKERLGHARFVTALLALLGAALALRSVAVFGFAVQHPFVWVLPMLRPDSVIAGLTLAVLAPRIMPAGWMPPAVVLAIGLVCLLFMPMIGTTEWDVLLYLVVGAVAGSTVWLCITSPVLNRVLSARVPRHLGRISYGLYLYHLPALGLVKAVSSRVQLSVPDTALALLALFLTWATAEASYRFVEAPFLRRKERLSAVASAPV